MFLYLKYNCGEIKDARFNINFWAHTILLFVVLKHCYCRQTFRINPDPEFQRRLFSNGLVV